MGYSERFAVPLPTTTAPRPVLAAGVLVGLQAVASIGFAVAVLVHALTAAGALAGDEFAEVGYFVVIGVGVGAVAAGLLLGRPWSRTPAAIVQLLLLGVSYYVFGASGQVLAGVLVAVFCVATLVLLFTGRARVWAARQFD